MQVAKVFENGRSQAVRLPKEFRFDSDEVAISKVGDVVMLVPLNNKWDSFIQAVDMFSEDFLSGGRPDQGTQERDKL